MEELGSILRHEGIHKNAHPKTNLLSALPEDLSSENKDLPPTVIQREPPSSLSPRPRHELDIPIPKDQVCKICRGVGFVLLDVPPGHPDFGKAIPCQCKQEERLWKRIREFHGTSDLEVLARYTFDTFMSEPAWLSLQNRGSLHRAFDASVEFAHHPEGWLVLSGSYGCGKTHLAAAIANDRLDRGQPVVFVVVPDLLDHLRTTFGPNSEVSYDQMFEQVRTTRLLVLDDFGAQSATPWAQEKIFQILNYRYNAQLPTVITTNQRMNTIDERIRSRMSDGIFVKTFHITAPDFRRHHESSDQSELSSLNSHRDKTFQNFIVERKSLNHSHLSQLRNAWQNAQEYAKNPRGWFVLRGKSGTGKTHLAAAIANYQIETHLTEVLFVSVAEFLDYLRSTFDPKSPTPYDRQFEEIKKAKMLVLDGLGMESATAWAKEKLFQLLDYRYNALLPTIITTHLPESRIDNWLMSRFQDLNRSSFNELEISQFQKSSDQIDQIARSGRNEVNFFSGDERSL